MMTYHDRIRVEDLFYPFMASPDLMCRAYVNAVKDGSVKDRALQMRVNYWDALRDQALYVLSNAGSWRGEAAREAKKAIKKEFKIK